MLIEFTEVNNMKIKIEYQYDAMNPPHFFAMSEINGRREFTAGNDWNQARSRHIEKLEKTVCPKEPPPPEEVELP